MEKRIIFLNINSNLGGAERVLFDEVFYMSREGINPLVILPKEGPLEELFRKNGIECRILGISDVFLGISREDAGITILKDIFLSFIEVIKYISAVRRVIEREKVFLIVSNSYKLHFISSFIKVITGRPLVWRYHDLVSRDGLAGKLTRIFARKFPDKVITNSDYVREQFIKFLKPAFRVETVYPYIDPEPFLRYSEDKDRFRDEMSISREVFVVSCLGMLVYWKGQEVLIKAAAELRKHIPGLVIVIAGGNIYDTATRDMRKELMDLADAVGVGDITVFTGFIKDNYKVLAVSDLIVHTSTKPEPFGRVIVEAMLSERPVIATGAGGVKEIIEDGITGLFVDPGDHEMLTDAVLKIYKGEYPDMGAKGRNHILKNFSKISTVKKIKDMYNTFYL